MGERWRRIAYLLSRLAVTFVVERGKERQEWNEQKLPKVLPGYSGGRLPGRSTEEKGREEREEEEEEEERAEKATKWQNNGKRSNIWKTLLKVGCHAKST